MHARKLLAGLATTAVALSGIALTAGPASAAYVADPDDTTITPVSADLIGVGSDTTQHAMKLAADAWNAQSPAPAFKVATYAATSGGDLTVPGGGTFVRPKNSGEGKAKLFGAGNNAEIDYARSSSAVSTDEGNAGLRAFPFALDSLAMAVSKSVASNAPASITPAQIVDIYEGDITNWSQIDPSKSGTIKPLIPFSGSGTRSFFQAQLNAIKGSTVTIGGGVAEVQEHEDDPIKNDANAIAPFSVGRAGLTGGTLRLLTGWGADRAVYNVVRQADLADSTKGPRLQAFFGESGFLCSTSARSLIEAAGFKQLATPAHEGACGSLVTSTTNFVLNEQVVTTTKLAITSTAAGTAKLVATVTGSSAPSGTVSFYNGETLLQSNVPLVSGQATATVSKLTPGKVSYRAEFVPTADSAFEPSEAAASGVVKTSSKVTAKFAKKAKAGKAVKGTVTVTLAGISDKATGTVKVKLGSKTVASGKLSGGKVKLTLKKLKAGKANKLKAIYSGDSNAVGSQASFTVKVAKAKK